MDTIIVKAGGKKIASFEFKYRGENLSLQWKGDLNPLMHNHGELNIYMTEWIKAWPKLRV